LPPLAMCSPPFPSWFLSRSCKDPGMAPPRPPAPTALSSDSGKVPHDPPAPTTLSSDVSADDSAQPFKTNFGQHAVDDPETNSPSNSNNHPLQQPADNSHHTPAQHDDNGSPAVTDGADQVDGIESASPKLADDDSTNSGNASADPDINDQQPADNSLHTLAQPDDGPHPADPPVDVTQLASFKFADDGSAHTGAVPYDPSALTALPSDSSGDDSAQPFKTNLDHHAVDDPETNSPSNSN